jgi:uncharacterized protein (TIGR02231 family)
MRHLAFAALAALFVTPAFAADLDVTSGVDAVTVYPDGATVTRVIRADLPAGDTTLVARDFPLTLDPSSLRVEAQGAARFTIGAIDARRPQPGQPANLPELEKRLEQLGDQRTALDDAITAAVLRRKFVERFATSVPLGLGEHADARPIAEWRTAFSAVADETAAVDTIIRDTRVKHREIDREIARVRAEAQANPPRKMEVRIDLAAEAAGTATLRVSYTVRSARWTPLYDARLDTGARERKAELELVRRAEITQSTGEDWKDVELAVSTASTAKGGDAPSLPPLLVSYPQPVRPPAVPAPTAAAPRSDAASFAARDRRQLAAGKVMAKMQPAAEREATVETGGYQVVFRIPGRVSVVANAGAKALRIASAKISPELMVRAVPALDETAFLQASFKQTEDALLFPGRVALYRDGTFVGQGRMPLTPKDETVHLGFGADDKVKVARAVVRKNAGSTGLISTSKTDEREFKFTVRNGHAQPIKVQIEDQIPVSEVADVVVEMLPQTTPPTTKDVDERRGVLAWTFDAPPGEQREVKLAWRVSWPSGKTVVYQPRMP